MKSFRFLVPSLIILAACSKQNGEYSKSISIRITNNQEEAIQNFMVHFSERDLKSHAADFNPSAFVLMDGEMEIPSQYNADDKVYPGVVAVIAELGAGATKSLSLQYNPEGSKPKNYTKQTQAELSHKVDGEWKEREYIGGDFLNVDYLRVPPEHKDHSWFIRYEGPGWESDKVGYRFYLDQRNAVDVFGKTKAEPVLQKAGLDGFDSYHEMQDWGMDVMKVGPSLGVGSIGIFQDTSAVRVEFTDSVTCSITENGPVFSSILTKYYGWKTRVDTIDVESELSIHAGTRLTYQVMSVSSDLDQFCSGLVKDSKAQLLTKEPTSNSYGYIATYGPQSLNNDNLGIAVLFSGPAFNGFAEDQNSHIVKLKSSQGKLDYYFLAAWEGEPGGIKTKEEFVAYLDKVIRDLGQPVSISFE